jgi:hypothetical protein
MTGPAAPSVPPGEPPVGTRGEPPAVAPGESEVRPDQLSLGARLRQPRTIISLVLPILLLALFAKSLPGFKLEELPAKILGANPWLLIAAFVIFYAGFPLRGLRWAMLVHRSGFPLTVRDSTEIIFLSWLVNCLVPAKLGDVYRAYLLKINSPVSLSRTFGTVFIERILDLFAIVVLGLAAGFVSFRSGLPADVQLVFLIGVLFVLVLAGGLLTIRNSGAGSSGGAAPFSPLRAHSPEFLAAIDSTALSRSDRLAATPPAATWDTGGLRRCASSSSSMFSILADVELRPVRCGPSPSP